MFIDPVIPVALFLVAKRFSVADEELNIARVRLVHARVVDFIDDAMAEREPDPAAHMIRGAEAFLRTGGPAGLDAGCTERVCVIRSVHVRMSDASTGHWLCGCVLFVRVMSESLGS